MVCASFIPDDYSMTDARSVPFPGVQSNESLLAKSWNDASSGRNSLVYEIALNPSDLDHASSLLYRR